MNVIEKRIVAEAIEALDRHGWKWHGVDDGETVHTFQGGLDSPADAWSLMNELDECTLYFRKGAFGRGWLRLIFDNGNDGRDVMCDNSVNLNDALAGVDTEFEGVYLTNYEAKLLRMLIDAEIDDPLHLGSNGGQFLSQQRREALTSVVQRLKDEHGV